MSYTQDEIESVIQRNPILDVFHREFPHLTTHKVGSHEWVSGCPVHGGKDGFHITDNKQLFHCWSSCEKIGNVIQLVQWGLGKSFTEAMEYLGAGQPVNTEELERRRAESERLSTQADAADEAKRAAVRIKLAQLPEELNANMTDADIAWWEKNLGVEREWLDYYQLGKMKDVHRDLYGRCYGYQTETPYDPIHAEAFTIPFYGADDSLRTIQLRYRVPNGRGKYEFPKLLGAPAFITRRDLPIPGSWVLVVEGAKKAIVSHILGTNAKMQVIGLPSQGTLPADIIEPLRAAKVVVFLLDPDSHYPPSGYIGDPRKFVPFPIRHAEKIGWNACVAELPGKIDDHLVSGNITPDDLRVIIARAAKSIRH